ncbi:unnamed protein product [Toxocara canis]|uniref:Uncharacterized protein n=1 Tax=Toxocara canis TaxID=6265 RepID=A0A183U8N7_TOXCA|nr:unnamed protein product [Toxocara canis]
MRSRCLSVYLPLKRSCLLMRLRVIAEQEHSCSSVIEVS